MSIGPRDKPYPLIAYIDSATNKPAKIAEASAIFVSSVSAITVSATNYLNLPVTNDIVANSVSATNLSAVNANLTTINASSLTLSGDTSQPLLTVSSTRVDASTTTTFLTNGKISVGATNETFGPKILFNNGYAIETFSGGGIRIRGGAYVHIADANLYSNAIFSPGYNGVPSLKIRSNFLTQDILQLSQESTSTQTANYLRITKQITGSTTSDLLVFNSSGNLGINVSGPTEKLHVSGNALINGNVSADTLSINAPSSVTTTTKPLNVYGVWNTTSTPTLVFINASSVQSGTNSLLLDIQHNSSQKFRIFKSGQTFFSPDSGANINLASNRAFTFGDSFDMALQTGFTNNGLLFPSSTNVGIYWSSGSVYNSTTNEASITKYAPSSLLVSANTWISGNLSATNITLGPTNNQPVKIIPGNSLVGIDVSQRTNNTYDFLFTRNGGNFFLINSNYSLAWTKPVGGYVGSPADADTSLSRYAAGIVSATSAIITSNVSALNYFNLSGPMPTYLSALYDVSSPLNPTNYNVLMYSGTKWIATNDLDGGTA